MKTFMSKLTIIGLVFLSISCNHDYNRKTMTFDGTEVFKMVSMFDNRLDESVGTMNISNTNVKINNGTCSFGGDYSADDTNLKFFFTNVERSSDICEGDFNVMEVMMSGLSDPKNGYGLKIHAFNSDWVVLAVNNESSGKVDSMIGQKYYENADSLYATEESN